ncbi:MAG: carbohydrate ABC transporter permease [Candidatus Hodarchaeales archaeon]
MTEVTEIITTDHNYTFNALISIVIAAIFVVLGIIIPITGIMDGFLISDVESYFLGKMTVFGLDLSYDQMAGLSPVNWGIIRSEYWLLFLLLFLWQYPFIVLSIIGAIVVIIPPLFYMLKITPPSFLANPYLGLKISAAATGVEWLLFVVTWLVLPLPKPAPNLPLAIVTILAMLVLFLSCKIWLWQESWQFALKNTLRSSSFYAFVVVTVLYCVFPFFWAVIQSFQDPGYIKGYVEYLPSNPSIGNYQLIFDVFSFQGFIFNSFFISILTVILCVMIAAFGAYVLAKFQFKLKSTIMSLILSMTMFPGIVILIPLYMEYVFLRDYFNIELINTYIGLLLPYITFNLPLTLFLLYNFFQEIPDELIKAARVDGAGHFQVFRKIILPLALPGVFTTGILVFIAAWNEFLFASLLLTTEDMWTIPKAMSLFTGIPQSGLVYNKFFLLNAATVVVTIPLIILVLIFQKQIVSGIVAGAVKG